MEPLLATSKYAEISEGLGRRIPGATVMPINDDGMGTSTVMLIVKISFLMSIARNVLMPHG
jgi:hypothetical protein